MVITVFGDEKHVVAAIEAGALGYLLKDGTVDYIARLDPRARRRRLADQPGDRAPPPATLPRARADRSAADDAPHLTEREHEVLGAAS